MSENTLNAALRRLGFSQDEMTSHGFRAAAASILNESNDPSIPTESKKWNPDAIEAQLAHVDKNAVREAYACRRQPFSDQPRLIQTTMANRAEYGRGPRLR